MALHSSFFDAELVNGEYDRVYSAEDFAKYFSAFVGNGVFPDPATNLQVTSTIPSSMEVLVNPGLGWINGYYCYNDGEYPLSISPADGTYPRVDAVVLRWSKSERSISLLVKSGVASADPVTPSLERSSDIYELMLASINVSAGVTNIPQALITDQRPNSALCGWVTGLVDQFDTSGLFAQYDDAFNTWFEALKAKLSGDVAANLQNQINILERDKVAKLDKATSLEAEGGTNDTKWMTPLATKKAIEKFGPISSLWVLIDTLDGTAGFSGEWVAPDVFGDGSAYDLGVYMISGAESGAAIAGVYKSVDWGESNESNSRSNTAEGGSSGNALNHIFKRVSPGASYAWVVGKGGAAKSGTMYGGYDKNPGGSTAFGGVTVSGGSDDDSANPSVTHSSETKFYFGGLSWHAMDNSYDRGAALERYILNWFDPTMITLAHGMYAYVLFYRYDDTGDWNSNKRVQTPAVPNPTIGVLGTGAAKIVVNGTGNATAKGVSGTRGNGGGGAIAICASGNNTVGKATATSGAGGDGVIFLYARRVVSE